MNLDGVGLTFSMEAAEVKCSKGGYWDSMSGKKLSAEGVTKARAEEMQEVFKHGLYVKVPIAMCWTETGRAPIGTRWVAKTGGARAQEAESSGRLICGDTAIGTKENAVLHGSHRGNRFQERTLGRWIQNRFHRH